MRDGCEPTPMTEENGLVSAALEVSKNAVAPHSKFHVGAALEAHDGTVYTGCNVESDSFGLTICAERVALTKALSEGARDFKRIAIVGAMQTGELSESSDSGSEATSGIGPCGACRQLLWDHCRNIEVLSGSQQGLVVNRWMLADLLPDAFSFKN